VLKLDKRKRIKPLQNSSNVQQDNDLRAKRNEQERRKKVPISPGQQLAAAERQSVVREKQLYRLSEYLVWQLGGTCTSLSNVLTFNKFERRRISY